MTHAYGEPSYWDQRYQSDPGTFDWYQKYPSLAPLFDRYLLRHHRLLLVGCGNSGILTLHPVFLLGSTHICHRFERIHLRNKLISGWTLRPSSPDPVLRISRFATKDDRMGFPGERTRISNASFARAPRSIIRRRASKKRRLGARPCSDVERFGRAPALSQALVRSSALVGSIKPTNAAISSEVNLNLLPHESRLCCQHLTVAVAAVFIAVAVVAIHHRRYCWPSSLLFAAVAKNEVRMFTRFLSWTSRYM
ncbi:hypothetical protein BHM03_00030748 [Ensete ventricosum]|uniref:Uncharacterized protein n=1 Tax=Ensete ventricosum TaxID=4639 RepID=A0A427BBK7_ENSVE|nr:hypothetical protein B296_00003474 [Ensete ventricosum]RZR73998.1 hypothetical protein BHM03_00030748 [Ensete ventricosum]